MRRYSSSSALFDGFPADDRKGAQSVVICGWVKYFPSERHLPFGVYIMQRTASVARLRPIYDATVPAPECTQSLKIRWWCGGRFAVAADDAMYSYLSPLMSSFLIVVLTLLSSPYECPATWRIVGALVGIDRLRDSG